MPEPTVITASEPAPPVVLIAAAPEMLVELARRESEPLVIVGIQPYAAIEGAFELVLRRPARQELQAAIMQRFKVEGAAQHG